MLLAEQAEYGFWYNSDYFNSEVYQVECIC